MNKFTTSRALFKRIKKDLNTQIFPDLLGKLATGAKALVEVEFARVSAKNKTKSPPLVLTVQKVPAPGVSNLKTSYLVGDEAKGDVYDRKAGTGYKRAFKKVCVERFGSKLGLLRVLASVGLS